jgi:hypothetical protein
MNKAFIVTTIIFLSVFISISCSKDNGGGGGTTTVDCSTVTNKAFAADVNPIIQGTCGGAGCHGTGSTNGPGALTNYAQISGSASSIRSAVSSGRMPKNSTLSSGQKNSIICWIDNGALNN